MCLLNKNCISISNFTKILLNYISKTIHNKKKINYYIRNTQFLFKLNIVTVCSLVGESSNFIDFFLHVICFHKLQS